MRFLLCAALLFFVPGIVTPLDLPLEVLNWADVARTGVPVTAGVPLPEGTLYDLTKLRVTDGSGNTVPAQFRPLSRWWRERHLGINQTPSVKWVLCDFDANIPAKNLAAYRLKDDGGNTGPAQTLTLTQDASQVTVTTGPLKFTVSKTSFRLFESVFLDANNNGQFETGEQIVAANAQSGGFIKAGNWAAGGCIDGTLHATSQQAPERVLVEEQGPMKLVLRIEGRHYAAANGVPKGLYGYRVFITAYAGQPFVDVQYAITNTLKEFSGTTTLDAPGYTAFSWPLHAYEVDLNLMLGGSQTYTLLGTTEASGALSGTPAVLHQGRGSFTLTGSAGGTDALGAAAVTDGNLGMMMAMRDFAPNSPKGIKLSTNKMAVELFTDTTAQYYLDPMTQKNHRLRFGFFKGALGAGALTAFWKENDAPPHMVASREWYEHTRAWDRGFGIPTQSGWGRQAPASWARLSGSAKASVNSWEKYGYIGEFNGGGDHWNLTSAFWWFLLTGDPKEFEASESRAFYFNDLVPVQYGYTGWNDFKHYTEPEDHLQTFSEAPHPEILDQIFGTYNTFPGFVWHRNNLPDAGHMPNMQEIEYYLLTGDPATFDAIKSFGTHAVMSIFYRTYGLYSGWPYSVHNGALVDLEQFQVMPYGPRYVARPMIVASHAYEVTGDERFFYPMSIFAYSLRNYTRANPIGYIASPNDLNYVGGATTVWNTNHPGVTAPSYYSGSDFQIGIANEALYNYWKASGDESVRDALILSSLSYEWRAAKSGTTYQGLAYSGWADYLCDGKRYNDVGLSGSWTSSASEGFGGLIFGYLASGRPELYKMISDGLTSAYPNFTPTGNTLEMKLINMWEAVWKHDSLDITPPAPISNLTAVAAPGVGVKLDWSAPGDDGSNGTAANYQIKYAKAPIVDFVKRWDAGSNTGWPDLNAPLPATGTDLDLKARAYQDTKEIAFWNGWNTAGEPAPKIAGSAESHIVGNLPPKTLCYFAIVSYDDAGNVSGLSNVVSLTTGTESALAPAAGDLIRIFPNPFHGVARFQVSSFGLEGRSSIRLAIYDARGRMIRRFEPTQNSKPETSFSFDWNGRDAHGAPLPAGVYLCRLTAGNKTFLRKMALVR